VALTPGPSLVPATAGDAEAIARLRNLEDPDSPWNATDILWYWESDRQDGREFSLGGPRRRWCGRPRRLGPSTVGGIRGALVDAARRYRLSGCGEALYDDLEESMAWPPT
jgi:hypothetical protein